MQYSLNLPYYIERVLLLALALLRSEKSSESESKRILQGTKMNVMRSRAGSEKLKFDETYTMCWEEIQSVFCLCRYTIFKLA